MGCVVSTSSSAAAAEEPFGDGNQQQQENPTQSLNDETINTTKQSNEKDYESPTLVWKQFLNSLDREECSESDSEDDLIRPYSSDLDWHQQLEMHPNPTSFERSQVQFSIDTSRAKSNAPVVSHCAAKLGIQEFAEPRMDGKACDIYWHSVVYADMKNVVKGGGRVNKFPGMTELAKKIALTQAIRSMRQLFPEEYAFYPQSWILPAQMAEFKAHCEDHKGKSDQCFIVKPDEGAQGTGIYLVENEEQLRDVQSKQLVQEYVTDPYLLPDELKFDLRVYAVIKSINPLSIYVAREGMARFCTEKYVRPNAGNLDNLFAHLTNYSLNKANYAYVHSKSLREQLKGSKRLLSTVFHQMEHKGVRTRRLWREIKLLIAKTVLAMVPEIMLNYEHNFGTLKCDAPQCFQIMGFDILVRSNGHPVLLEVNSAPSLSVGHSLLGQTDESPSAEVVNAEQQQPPPVRSIVDEMIKFPLVRDCLLLVLDQLDNFYPARTKNNAKIPSTSRKSNLQDVTNKRNDVFLKSRNKWEVHSLDSIKTTRTSAVTNSSSNVEDDLGLMNKQNRAHLSEIFPSRYGQTSKHLLVLDRAVYLYLQFVAIRQTLQISLPTLKAFLRKCDLSDILSVSELEAKFAEISLYFSSSKAVFSSGAPALPFHGIFSSFEVVLSHCKMKFPSENGTLLASVVQLFAHCDQSLRRVGVRSSRLRHAELKEEEVQLAKKHNEESGKGNEKISTNDGVKIYLLPNRMPRRSIQPNIGEIGTSRKRAKQPNRTRSLPRKFGATIKL